MTPQAISNAIKALINRIEDLEANPESLMGPELTVALSIILRALEQLEPEDRATFEDTMRDLQKRILRFSDQLQAKKEEVEEELKSQNKNVRAQSAYGRTQML